MATEDTDKRFREEEVRDEDLQPYVTLRYIARLFKILAALMTLIGEATKLLVIAGLMWGGGDITILLIDAGHDLRVARILLGRINNALNHEAPPVERRPARGATGS